MKTTGIILTAAFLSAMTSGANAADATRGKQIFDKVGCWQCHGYEGQGANTGPKLAPEPMALDALASFLRNASATAMPPYSEKVLSNSDVADIHAYLASIRKPPSARDIPLLQTP